MSAVNDVLGHLGLFSVNPDYMPQIDRHLSELLGTDVARLTPA
jgi:homoserine O-acetyltransferase/O-succinyltransferase